jgi:hypothetical protein
VANIAKDIESESSMHKTWSALPFCDNTQVFSDPLLWWKQEQFLLLILSCLAQKQLCIPATEAPSEQIFSTASLLLSKFRNWMDPELAGRTVFIRKHIEWYEALL